jgi:hypothetical protein
VFIKYWAGLHNPADRELITSGAEALSREAMNIMPSSSARRRVLQGGRSNVDAGEIVVVAVQLIFQMMHD